MNEVTYQGQGLQDARRLHDLEASKPGTTLHEDPTQHMLAEIRRDLAQQVDWQVQQQLAAQRGPALAEVTMILGSLVVGAVVTGILVTNATTVVSGFLGTQSATHLDTLPFVALVWLALIIINIVWARRR